MENIILYLIPLLITFYLYLLPKVLIRYGIDNYIKEEFADYIKNDTPTFEDIREKIYRVTNLLSFLGIISGILISVFFDEKFLWNNIFKIATVLFFLGTIYFILQYGFNSLKLTKPQKIIEPIFIILSLFMLLLNVYLRNLL